MVKYICVKNAYQVSSVYTAGGSNHTPLVNELIMVSNNIHYTVNRPALCNMLWVEQTEKTDIHKNKTPNLLEAIVYYWASQDVSQSFKH